MSHLPLFSTSSSKAELPASAGTPSPSDVNMSLASVVERAGKLLSRAYFNSSETADRRLLEQARASLQSWATIRGSMAAVNVQQLYQKAPGLRTISCVNPDLTETTLGQEFWASLETWWQSSNYSSGYQIGTGESLLRTVQRLHEISPLSADIDPLNSKLGGDNAPLIPGYYSELQLAGSDGSTKDRAADEKQKVQCPDQRLSGGNTGEPERFSRPWFSRNDDDNESQDTDRSKEPEEMESVVDTYDEQWKSIISLMYLTNFQAMQAIQPLLETTGSHGLELNIRRFRVWGCSLFSQELSLDAILQSSQDSTRRLKALVIGTLGDIALIQGRLLRLLADTNDTIAQRALLSLQASFGRFKEVNDAVLEIPDSFYDDIQHQEEVPLASLLENQLTSLIDCLFEVMPAISRVRRVYLLRLERDSQKAVSIHNTLTTPPIKEQGLRGEKQYFYPQPTRSGLSPGIRYDRWQQMKYLNYETLSHLEHFGPPDNGDLQGIPAMSGGKAPLSPPYASHDPMLEMLEMDIELAEAIKESLAMNQRTEKAQASENRSAMRQIMEWEREIARLKDWSRIFEKSLGTSLTPAETEARIAAFGNLVNIGCVFASAIPKHLNPKSLPEDPSSTEEKIRRMVAAMPGGYSMELKIDSLGKSPSDALKALSQANKALPNFPLRTTIA